jgi:cytochrome c
MRYSRLIVLSACCVAAASAAHADGDATRGKMLYEARCSGCHSVDANRVGPAHRGVFGRQAGSAHDYEYSPALRQSKIVWNEVNLERWLASPEQLIPGQKMGYAVSDATDRADLIAYLQDVSQ